MVKALVLRGMGVGALAGLISFVFARIFAEPVVQAAIDYEGARDEAKAALATAAGDHAEHEGPEVFSRVVQADVGLGFGIVAFGVALGLFFAAVYCVAHGRMGGIRPTQLSLLVAMGGFMTLFMVPFLKYPANPPSIGNGDTIAQRAGLYGVMVIASIAAALLAVWLGQRLQPRLGNWGAAVLGSLAFLVVVGVVMALLPALGQVAPNTAVAGSLLTETPQPLVDPSGTIVLPGFDADLLYRFRLYSVGAQLLLWTAIGVGFAPLAERVLAGDRPGVEERQPATFARD